MSETLDERTIDYDNSELETAVTHYNVSMRVLKDWLDAAPIISRKVESLYKPTSDNVEAAADAFGALTARLEYEYGTEEASERAIALFMNNEAEVRERLNTQMNEENYLGLTNPKDIDEFLKGYKTEDLPTAMKELFASYIYASVNSYLQDIDQSNYFQDFEDEFDSKKTVVIDKADVVKWARRASIAGGAALIAGLGLRRVIRRHDG